MKRRKKLDIRKINPIESKKDDIIRVTDFKVTPVTPKRGQRVNIKLTIKNVSSKTLKGVPWQVVLNKKLLDCGARFNLPAGESFKVSLTWTATAGKHFFYADADPDNILREPRLKQFNNLPQGIDVKVE